VATHVHSSRPEAGIRPGLLADGEVERIVAWMRLPRVRRVQSVPGRIACILCVAAFGYWATGLRPFTLTCYFAVGIPIVVVGSVLAFAGRTPIEGPRHLRAEPVRLRRVLPWLLVALATACLEGWGLALGGRSSAVPTLSTVLDHALTWHALRLVLFCGWLVLGSVPLVTLVRGHTRVS
jgi:hypothetical protein